MAEYVHGGGGRTLVESNGYLELVERESDPRLMAKGLHFLPALSVSFHFILYASNTVTQLLVSARQWWGLSSRVEDDTAVIGDLQFLLLSCKIFIYIYVFKRKQCRRQRCSRRSSEYTELSYVPHILIPTQCCGARGNIFPLIYTHKQVLLWQSLEIL